MAKDDFGGHRLAFDKAGKVTRQITSFSACPECAIPMEVTRTWRRKSGSDRDAYEIRGLCPNGHVVERYGYGEAI